MTAAPTQPDVRDALIVAAVSSDAVALHFRRGGVACVAVGIIASVDERGVRVEALTGSYIVPIATVVRVEVIERRAKEPPP